MFNSEISTFTELNDFVDYCVQETNIYVDDFHLKCEELNRRNLDLNSLAELINSILIIVNKFSTAEKITEMVLNDVQNSMDSIEKMILPIENTIAIYEHCNCQPFDPVRKPMYDAALKLSCEIDISKELLTEFETEKELESTPRPDLLRDINNYIEKLEWINKQLIRMNHQINEIGNYRLP